MSKQTTAYRHRPRQWAPVVSEAALQVGDVALFECLGNSRLFTMARVRDVRADGRPMMERLSTLGQSDMMHFGEDTYVVFVPSANWHFVGAFRTV
ncbi:hypothetical protein [Bifidobacterium vansinderenii]|uniref:Uncharacterized protein n=1 Tax=Bifidobacterium vansinderenii TaxID=1984871 RepID=A0A229VZQ7_9BIFI|nr:hypothetical protein [Bifidobacterium vansinderenii]OXN01103.1 hypothetical protein Tam10B_0682 [Bifidobacterium vansinderenii]